MPGAVWGGTSESLGHFFFLNSLLLTFHRVGRSVGDLMARVTWLCGLWLETFDHGIFVGKPYQKIAWYRRARHPSNIIKGVIQGNLPKPSVVCIMFPRSLKRNHKGIFIQACRKYCKNFLICSQSPWAYHQHERLTTTSLLKKELSRLMFSLTDIIKRTR